MKPPVLSFLFFILVPIIALLVPIFVLRTTDFGISVDGSSFESKDVELALKLAESQIFKGYFEIFLSISAVVTAIAAIVGFNAYFALRSSVEKQIDKEIEKWVHVAQARTLATTFNEFAYMWFLRYEEILQRHLNGEPVPNGEKVQFTQFVTAALDVAEQGLSALRMLDKDLRRSMESTNEGLRPSINLKNQLLYGTVAKALMENTVFSVDQIDDLERQAQDLQRLSTKKLLGGGKWWEAYETTAFFYIHIGRLNGDPKMVRTGASIVRNMINQKPPKAHLTPLPQDQRLRLEDEYERRGFLL